ncbi:hypothetical protein ACFL7D_02950 [candidate division KSB1 bacterium]
MDKKDLNIAKQHINEVIEYQTVLSIMLRHKVSIQQAMVDWIEKGFAKKYYKDA